MAVEAGAVTAVFILGYLLAQMALGLWIGRKAATTGDYFLAGRRLGTLPIVLSLFATWFGAETVIGSSAAVAEGGLAATRAEPFGYAIALLLMAVVVAAPFRASGYVTLADFFRERFDRRCERLAAALTILASVIWAAAQLLALSAVLAVALDLPPAATLVASAAVVILYASFGGMLSDVATDVVQGGVVLVGLVALLVTTADALGGLEGFAAAIQPEQLRLVAPGEAWLSRADSWAAPVLGSLVTQEALSRLLAARDAATARRACFGAAALYLAAGLTPVLLALGGARLLPDAGSLGDGFLPALVETLLAPLWALALTAALLSAILSTVDSNILSVSAMVTKNLLPEQSGRAALWTARATTVAAGLTALAIAAMGAGVSELIALTSTFGQGGLLIAVLIGLFSRFGGPLAALAGMGAGVAVNVWAYALYPLIGPRGAGGAAPELAGAFLASLLASLLSYGLAAVWERRQAGAPKPAPAD